MEHLQDRDALNPQGRPTQYFSPGLPLHASASALRTPRSLPVLLDEVPHEVLPHGLLLAVPQHLRRLAVPLRHHAVAVDTEDGRVRGVDEPREVIRDAGLLAGDLTDLGDILTSEGGGSGGPRNRGRNGHPIPSGYPAKGFPRTCPGTPVPHAPAPVSGLLKPPVPSELYIYIYIHIHTYIHYIT